MDGALAPAVEAICCGKLRSAIWAHGLALKCVECMLATAALPELSDGGRLLAMRAGKVVTPGQFFHAGQSASVLPAAPGVHEHIDGDKSHPDGFHPPCKCDKPERAQEPHDGRDHQTSRSSEHKPEQGAKYLTAVEGINGEQVEGQQDEIDDPDGMQQGMKVALGASDGPAQRVQDRNQRYIDQWPGGDTPQSCARPRRRIDVSHAAEWPQDDLIRGTSYLPASQGVAELVKQHDTEERQVLEYIPSLRGVASFAVAELESGHQKP